MKTIDYLCDANHNVIMAEFNDMQQLKRRLFAMRNGAVADNMRRQGADYRIIFGVNLPQLVEIAGETPHNTELAERLWQNKTTRESLLIAPMIYPRDEFSIEIARRWITEIPSAEVADILCHRLLRHLDYAESLSDEFIASSSDLERYTALRLMCNLLPAQLDTVKAHAEVELSRGCALTSALCLMLIEEISFLQE